MHPVPDVDDSDPSESSDDGIPLKMKGKTKPRGKGKTKVTVAWVDSDTESESLKVASEFDSPKLSKKEKEDLAHGYDPVKIHQRAMARKLETKAHSCKSTSPYRLGASLTSFQAEKISVALVFITPNCALFGEI